MSIISGLTWAQAPRLSIDLSSGLLGPFTVEEAGEERGEGKGGEKREGTKGAERRGEWK